MTDEATLIPHPIQLHSTVFTKSVCMAVIGYEPGPDKEDSPPINKLNLRSLDEEPGFYVGTMRTVINEDGSEQFPYKIDIECHAKLSADNTLTADETRRGIAITAHSVLYGAIREQVAWLTSRQPHGPLYLGLSILTPAKAPAPDPEPDQR